MKNKILTVIIILLVIGVGVYVYRGEIMTQLFKPTESTIETGVPTEKADPLEVVVEGLTIPWELVFLPNSGGDMLVTERPGRLVYIGEGREVIEVSGVAHRGEGGLLGLALHPKYSDNGLIYLYMTTSESGGLTNRVERYRLQGTKLTDRKVIIENIPGAPYHDGGRIAFGPDGMLYITTGDAGNEDSAQNTKSLAGKILRLDEDGGVPKDNPFNSAVYSYGHRNVQGIAWDKAGQLWATEHGRSGIHSGFDEVNKIVKGANYGWPLIQGDESQEGLVAPDLHSGASETWAPSGMAYLREHLVFAGLRGESLYVAEISRGKVEGLKVYLRGEYGRLRSVTVGPDGMLYVLTSNRDGRGKFEASDDRIIKINPEALGIRE